MSTLPPKGQGPFQRGERLTAAKLNELAAPKAIRVFGQGHVEGDTITVDQRESMYIRLTNKTGSAPIKYAWKEVYRESNGTWVNMTHTGNVTNDFAVEINNSNLSTSDNYVYRAERSLTTGEWLFFLRRSANTTPDIPGSNITVLFEVLPGLTYPGWLCNTTPQITGLTGDQAFSLTTPDPFRISAVTLSYTTNANVTSTIGVWTSSNVSYGNITFTPPYEPNGTRPLTITCDATLANGTILGVIDCGTYDMCGNTFDYVVLDNTGSGQIGFYEAVNANVTACSTVRTSAGGTVVLSAKVNANASVNVPMPSITLPTCLTYVQTWSCSGATCCGTLLNFLNAPRTVAASYSTTAVTSSHSNSSVPFTRNGQSSAVIGWTFNEDWTVLPAWPNETAAYSHGVLEQGYSDTGRSSASPVRTVTASYAVTHYGTPCTSVNPFTGNLPVSKSIFDTSSNNYTISNSTFTPSGSCS